MEQRQYIDISNLSNFFKEITENVKIQQFQCKITLDELNLVLLRKFCMKSRCFLEKFTQIAKILHDRRS